MAVIQSIIYRYFVPLLVCKYFYWNTAIFNVIDPSVNSRLTDKIPSRSIIQRKSVVRSSRLSGILKYRNRRVKVFVSFRSQNNNKIFTRKQTSWRTRRRRAAPAILLSIPLSIDDHSYTIHINRNRSAGTAYYPDVCAILGIPVAYIAAGYELKSHAEHTPRDGQQ